MDEHGCEIHSTGERFDRRSFLRWTSLAAAAGAVGGVSIPAGTAIAESLTQEQRDKMTPHAIVELMMKGNEQFRSGKKTTRNYLAEQRASATGQYPMAALVSCIDSRAPAEVILNLGIGDVFNCRIAGNISNDDILGSLEFACKVSGSKAILVMGHTACGAIRGAIDDVKLGNLTGLLAKIRPAVDATTFSGDRSSKNPAFVDAVAKQNVLLTIGQIRKQSPILAEMETKQQIEISGAMYDLKTAKIEFFPG